MTNRQQAERKAQVVVAMLTTFSVYYTWTHVHDWNSILAPLVYYVVLLISTYFSVRCFDALTPPQSPVQDVLDVVLVLFYFVLATLFTAPAILLFVTAAFFSVTTLKYILLMSEKTLPHFKQIDYKAAINGCGTISALLCYWIALQGNVVLGMWLWVAIFCSANFFIFFIKPLYRIPQDV